MKKLSILFLAFTFFVNCKESDNSTEPDCSTVSCLEMGYSIELISKDSEANWIIEKAYTEEDIQLLNEEEIVPFSLHNGNIWIPASNSNHGMHTLIVDELEIPYSYDFTEPDGSCCDFGDLKDVIVPNNEFKVSDFQLEIFL